MELVTNWEEIKENLEMFESQLLEPRTSNEFNKMLKRGTCCDWQVKNAQYGSQKCIGFLPA